ncbi:MAG: ABC transporter permease subunit [Caldilineaceae bacterium]|nr:ABC transporter permease subunit [Caldilineaceae bacterium]
MSQTTLTSGLRMTPPETGKPWHVRLGHILGQDWAAAYIFVLPTLVLMGGLIAYPFLRAVYMSFTNTVSLQMGPFVGLQNYENVWRDPNFHAAVKNTFVFTFWSIIFKFIGGLTVSILLHRLTRFSNILTAAILLPWIVPSVVAAIAWKGLLDPVYGGVNQFLIQTGLVEKGFPWFGSIHTAMLSLIMVNVWGGIPFFTVNLLAGLKAIDKEYYEAALIDGASAWRCFLHITLPGLRYVITVAVLLSTIWTFNSFDMIFLITGGGPLNATRVFSIFAFEAFGAGRFGAAVAIAITMAPILLIFIFLLGKYMSNSGRAEEAAVAEAPGLWSKIGRVLTWPFRMLLAGLVWLFFLVNDLVENLFSAMGAAIHRTLIGDSPQRQRQAYQWGRRLTATVAGLVLLAFVIFELTPFYWTMITAFKKTAQIVAFESVFWPAPWTMDQFDLLLGPTRRFGIWYWNTIQVSVISTLISVMVAAMGGYGLTRLRWRGANFFSSSVLVAYLMPGIMMFIPMYQIFTALKLTNSLAGLMVAYPVFGLPFATWLMMGYYASIPREMEEAAMIDGCNHFQAFWRVILPLTMPALMAAAMFSITLAWKEFIFAYIFLSKERLFTLTIGMAQMIVGDVLPWGELSAAALLMAIPVGLLYVVGQRFMVAGLTAGAVKG